MSGSWSCTVCVFCSAPGSTVSSKIFCRPTRRDAEPHFLCASLRRTIAPARFAPRSRALFTHQRGQRRTSARHTTAARRGARGPRPPMRGIGASVPAAGRRKTAPSLPREHPWPCRPSCVARWRCASFSAPRTAPRKPVRCAVRPPRPRFRRCLRGRVVTPLLRVRAQCHSHHGARQRDGRARPLVRRLHGGADARGLLVLAGRRGRYRGRTLLLCVDGRFGGRVCLDLVRVPARAGGAGAQNSEITATIACMTQPEEIDVDTLVGAAQVGEQRARALACEPLTAPPRGHATAGLRQ
jgi:hypothetical protein